MQTFAITFKEFLSRQHSEEKLEFFDIEGKLNSYGIHITSDKGIFISGGAIRRTIQGKPLDSDVDLFFTNGNVMVETHDSIQQHCKLLTKTDTNSTFEMEYFDSSSGKNGEISEYSTEDKRKIKIQLIYISYYSSMEELLNSFDYTICQFGYCDGKLCCGDYSLYDLGRNRLVVNKITYPVASLRRLIKYTSQGFYACSGALTEFLNHN